LLSPIAGGDEGGSWLSTVVSSHAERILPVNPFESAPA